MTHPRCNSVTKCIIKTFKKFQHAKGTDSYIPVEKENAIFITSNYKRLNKSMQLFLIVERKTLIVERKK